MNPSYPGPVKVRYKNSASVLYIVAGSVLIACGLLILLLDALSFWLILGPLLLAAGIVMRSMPFMTFEPAQGALYLHGPFGNRVRTFGAPKGQRLYFDGTALMRVGADGNPKKIRTGSANPTDLQHLHQAVWAGQQQGR